MPGRRWPPASTACSLTILDTHIASLIAAAFLFQFGTGPIRGFATTLTFGLLANVFTAVFVSRTLFEAVLSRGRGTRLRIETFSQRLRAPNFDFLRWRWHAVALSAVVILIGIGLAIWPAAAFRSASTFPAGPS